MRLVAGGYTQAIIHTKTTSANPDPCVRWQTNIPKWLSIQRQHLLTLTHASGGRRKYPKWLSVQTQHLLILTHASGGRLKYPKWLSVQTQHLLILTHESGGRRIYPAVIRSYTVLLPRPVRSQVACGDTQWLSFATPTCENRVTCGDTQGLSVHTFMLPWSVRSQVACEDALYGNPHTFRR